MFLPLRDCWRGIRRSANGFRKQCLLQPFENLTEMYGLPKYGELDPTPYTAPFYLVFFGMMAADLGYGALLWLGTFIVLKFFHFDKGMNRNLKFFHLLSYPVMIWGLYLDQHSVRIYHSSHYHSQKTLLRLWSYRLSSGVIQIMVGLSLGAYSNLKKKACWCLHESSGWLAIITGIILYVLGSMVLNISWIATIGSSVRLSQPLRL